MSFNKTVSFGDLLGVWNYYPCPWGLEAMTQKPLLASHRWKSIFLNKDFKQLSSGYRKTGLLGKGGK